MATDLRTQITDALKSAMKAKDTASLGTLRLMNAAIKDQDIALRADGKSVGEPEILAILGKMVKQRQESAKAYEEGGRAELADRERQEIGVIETFLPTQLSEAEVDAAIMEAIQAVGATSIRDMGKVMGALKTKFTGQMDFGSVGAAVKAKLG
ncbi:MAG: GatB/YqeY domain-containing protein [Pseudomonadota bacterium]